ncbi:MAG: hypothetical protein R3D02_07380 [Hyphomicrobiales bacterium]
MTGELFAANRIILLHKQATSARVRIYVHSYGGICGFSGLAEAVEISAGRAEAVVVFPPAIVAAAAAELGIAGGDLVAEPEFRMTARAGGRDIAIHLARFTTIDPPFALAERCGGRFIEMSAARSLPANELALLRAAFETVMGG